MFRQRYLNFCRTVYRSAKVFSTLKKYRDIKKIAWPSILLTVAKCEKTQFNFNWDEESLSHEFLIKQATTVNVNAATQLLTVTLVAIQDTSQRFREVLTNEICLVRQAVEWGEAGTPPQHWEQLVAIRGSKADLKHNLLMLFSYMEYAEKIATDAAEISYLSGNTAASDAICERIEQAGRACRQERNLTDSLQQESLTLQQEAILATPRLEDVLAEGAD